MSISTAARAPMSSRLARLLPGVALCTAISLVSFALQKVETAYLGHPLVEGLVAAILIGMCVRTFVRLPARFDAGIDFTAKQILEVAIVILGASVDLPVLFAAGPALAVGIVAVVGLGIASGTLIGRALGLHPKHALLVACGNSICGNSAIAAVAPVIGARKDHVASAIAFTAILGVAVVVGLPLLAPVLGFDHYEYGVLAGMTVYAVPQVLAAAFPVSPLSGEVGTLVKLVRVLLLGPLVLAFSLIFRDRSAGTKGRIQLGKLVPWFIVGFLALAALRSAGVIPASMAAPMRELSGLLTLGAMAGLGLGVDLRALRSVGKPLLLTVGGSLAVLVTASALLIKVLALHG
ncbi:YeiH family protein [Vulgatibacter incomptus]|uniref:Putative membrane protein YeiH n=1 Tax=Vulgatibacter incomptus TaxID=1391653 RepID=A0A0K1PHA1_9BACT|nr:putative sulfate exporter family transporter [Vulgatibacter incomptus]AKU92887.1 Putative membrane protein YeiH [Vulgatibacter incomptus]